MSESVLKSNMTLQPTVLPNGKAHSRKLTTCHILTKLKWFSYMVALESVSL